MAASTKIDHSRRFRRLDWLGAGSSAALLVFSGGASAQTAPAKEPDAPVGVDAVLVTARKRGSEDLQSAPLAITAIPAKRLETLNATDFDGYARTVPSLSFTDQGAGRRDISIRGVNAAYESGIGDPTVGVYLDEVPMTALGHQPDLSLFDVEQVEVLRGPQGTLYGEGAMGGAIRVLQRQPDLRRRAAGFRTAISTTRNGGLGYDLHGALNVPIVTDRWAVRASLHSRKRAGFIDRIDGEENANSERVRGGKIISRLAITSRQTLTLQALRERSRANGFPTFKVKLGDLRTEAIDDHSDSTTALYTGKYEADFGLSRLVVVVGRSRRDFQTATDLSSSGGMLSMPGARALAKETSRSWVGETRLSGDAAGRRLHWLAGGFFKDTAIEAYSQAKGNVAAFTPPGPDGLPPEPHLAIAQEAIDESRNRQWAGFGELGYDLTPRLSLTMGGRLTAWRQRRGPGDLITPPPGSPTPPGPQTVVRSSASKATGKLLATYQHDTGKLFYLQASQGFRAGGRNENLFSLSNVPAAYEPDTSWNYELGWKTAWFERRLTLNGALFHIDWSQMQTRKLALDPNGTGLSAGYITNAGKADVSGLELEATTSLGSGLGLFGGLSYLKAELAQDQPDADGFPGRHGDPIPFVPNFTANASLSYARALPQGMNAVFALTYQYYGSVSTQFNAASPYYFKLRPQHLVGAQAGLDKGFWRASLFVDNLLDHRAQLNREAMVSPFGDRLDGEDWMTTNRPRTVGLKLERRL